LDFGGLFDFTGGGRWRARHRFQVADCRLELAIEGSSDLCEASNNFGMLGSDIGCFAHIGRKIIQRWLRPEAMLAGK